MLVELNKKRRWIVIVVGAAIVVVSVLLLMLLLVLVLLFIFNCTATQVPKNTLRHLRLSAKGRTVGRWSGVVGHNFAQLTSYFLPRETE